MERLAPTPKDKTVSFPLPKMKGAMDAFKAASSVLTAVSDEETYAHWRNNASWGLSIAIDALWSWLR